MPSPDADSFGMFVRINDVSSLSIWHVDVEFRAIFAVTDRCPVIAVTVVAHKGQGRKRLSDCTLIHSTSMCFPNLSFQYCVFQTCVLFCLAGGQPHQAQQAGDGRDGAGTKEEGRQGAHVDTIITMLITKITLMMLAMLTTMVTTLMIRAIDSRLRVAAPMCHKNY